MRPSPDLNQALLYSVQTATNLLGSNVVPLNRLTGWGDALQILLRLIGPLLLGLAVVSLRGRVSR